MAATGTWAARYEESFGWRWLMQVPAISGLPVGGYAVQWPGRLAVVFGVTAVAFHTLLVSIVFWDEANARHAAAAAGVACLITVGWWLATG